MNLEGQERKVNRLAPPSQHRYVWEMAERAKVVAVRFKGANDPAAELRQVWAAHERVRVRRGT